MDSNLLKEAIADAKAVRQTALANAKVALEEAFTERFQGMFANKLKEDAGVAPQAEEGTHTDDNVSTQEVDELIKELEAEVGGEQPSPEIGGEPTDGADSLGGEVPQVPGAEGAEGENVKQVNSGDTVKIAPGATVTLTTDGGADEIGAEPEVGAEPTGGSPVPPTSAGEEDEVVDLDELLQSLKEEIADDEEEEEEEGKQLDEETKLTSSGIASKVGVAAPKQPSKGASASSHLEKGGVKDHGVPEGKVIAKDATTAKRPNEGPVTKNKMDTTKLTKEGIALKDKGVPEGKVEVEDATEASRPNEGPVTKTNMSTPALQKENAMLKKQLNEAESTIKYVKTQINEINLLNAKLLYTNKLFKEFTMTNENKMRIIEMFDLSKNVREVKLTYANIAEALNFGGNDGRKKVSPSSVQSITEGLASKTVGSTKPAQKEIISEQAGFANRMKQLAGIRSEKKK